MSKAERRKLEQIRRKRESQERLSEAYEKLAKAQVDPAVQRLIQSTSTWGGKETARQRREREQALEEVGLRRPAATPRARPDEPEGGEDSDTSDLDSPRPSGPDNAAAHTLPMHANPHAAPTACATEEAAEEAPNPGGFTPVRDLSSRKPPVQAMFRKRRAPEPSAEDTEARPSRRQVTEEERQRMLQVATEARQQLKAEGTLPEPEKEPQDRPRSVPSLGPTRARHVARSASIRAAREGLPILALETEIMAMVDEHDVFLLCGATGSGKTTQLPQFLLEAGFGDGRFPERRGLVGVTQPRRVAAVASAKRVATEVGESVGGCIGYQVRYDRVVSDATSVKYMTDGILLRELQDDFLLRRYSVIILDEVHERALNTDILLGVLSRLVPQRRAMHAAGQKDDGGNAITPLKLVVMSATLQVEAFVNNTRLFPQRLYPAGPPPVVNVPARQYPVTVHFSRRTELQDYVSAAFRKVVRIHKELPAGGVLVFLTGRWEVQRLCTLLQKAFGKGSADERDVATCSPSRAPELGEAAGAAGTAQNAGGGAGEEEADEGGAGAGDWDGLDEMEAAVDEAAWPDANLEGDTPSASDIESEADDSDEDVTVQLGDSSMTPEQIQAAEAFFEERYGLKLHANRPATAATRTESPSPAGRFTASDAAAIASSEMHRSGRVPTGGLELHQKDRHTEARAEADGGGCTQHDANNEACGTVQGSRQAPRSVASGPADALHRPGSGGPTTDLDADGDSFGAMQKQVGLQQWGALQSVPGQRHAPMHVLPLYAMLGPREQARVFADPPAGHRLVVVATNVAETSLTIPGIRYVIDAGRCKSKVLDAAAGSHRFEVHWISQASADQRAGRAGRTGPGHAYRLYSSAVFNDLFPRFSPPEIRNTALEGVVLGLRLLGLQNVTNFPFPSRPDAAALQLAESVLLNLSALERSSPGSSEMHLTALGRAMAVLPLPPRHARLILAAAAMAAKGTNGASTQLPMPLTRAGERVVLHAVTLAAALAVESPFAEGALEDGQRAQGEDRGQDGDKQRKPGKQGRLSSSDPLDLRCKESDALSALRALAAYTARKTSESDFCHRHSLHMVSLREAAALERQLLRLLASPGGLRRRCWEGHRAGQALLACQDVAAKAVLQARDLGSGKGAPSLGKRMEQQLRCCVLAGWGDQVARRLASWEVAAADGGDQGQSRSRAPRYQLCSEQGTARLHPASAVRSAAPEFVVFQALKESQQHRQMLVGVTGCEAAWLAVHAPGLAHLSKPLEDPAPAYNAAQDAVMAWVEVTFGLHRWPLPLHTCLHPDLAVRCAWFATALLEGHVASVFKQLAGCYNCRPSLVSRREGQALQRVAGLVQRLFHHRVDCRQRLADCLHTNGMFLMAEVQAVVAPSHHSRLPAMWPQLRTELGVA